jgi:CheY-like chemotaxis protein
MAAEGAEALGIFIQNRDAVQLVLTDMMMPTMDGTQLIRVLRLLKPKIRIVAMSGLDTVFGSEELDTLGVHEVVAKPFDATRLLQTIQRELTSGQR